MGAPGRPWTDGHIALTYDSGTGQLCLLEPLEKQNYSLSMPSVSPRTNQRCIVTNTMITGSMDIMYAALFAP